MLGLLVGAEIGHVRDENAAARGSGDVDAIRACSQAGDHAAAGELVDQIGRNFGGDDEERIAVAGGGEHFVDRLAFQRDELRPSTLQLQALVVFDGIGGRIEADGKHGRKAVGNWQ